MSIAEGFFLTLVLAAPVAVLLATGRACVCGFRAHRAGQGRYILLSVFSIVLLLALLAGVAVLWFIYAVSHGSKDSLSDQLILFGTLLLVYLASAFLCWQCSFFENRMRQARTGLPQKDSQQEST